MALLIIILLLWFMVHLARKGKKHRQDMRVAKYHAHNKRGMTKQESDELITVIIPTINNDK